jgi:RNA polymerase sigma-32 factor
MEAIMATAQKFGFGTIDQKFMKKAMSFPLLDRDHEHDLATKWRNEGDEAALHELTNAYVRLAISAAARYRNYGLPMNDLIQEGMIGLMQAAERFDPERGVRFSTYASWWIRSSMQDYILRNWSIVRTGTTAAHKSLFFNLRRLRQRIEPDSDRPLSHEGRENIAETLGVNVRDVEMMEGRLSGVDRSLNSALSDGGDSEWQDFLPDPGPGPEELVMTSMDAKARSRWLEAALTGLNPRELMIIQERRLKDETATLASLGDKLGISKERVRQIEAHALKKLRTALEAATGDPVAAGLVDYARL